MGAFDDSFVAFEGSKLHFLSTIKTNYVAHVVHIVDQNCPCSRFSQPHIMELEARYSNEVLFSHWQDLPQMLQKQITIPASPAVVIWAGDGELAYFGPYSGGATCGQGSDFVSATIEKLKTDENPEWINHDVLGCYCPWNNTST